jgi:hypothetical protein
MKASELKSMNYIGSSMNPTLKPGVRLDVKAYQRQKIRRGDVVVFISPEDGSKVVHRVVAVDSKGIKTKGDNCIQEDEWVLRPDLIFGRVVYSQRGNKHRRVFGGPLGQLFATFVRSIHLIDSGLSSLLRPAYDRLAGAGIFKRWIPTRMKPRIVSFGRPAGKELQLLMGRRVIGRWLPGKSGWNIRRPFRLFVDETSLPENPGKGSVVRRQPARHSRSGDGGLSVANEDI